MTDNLQYKELDGLSPSERELALKILKEFSEKGTSNTFKELEFADYKEQPVDIETFVTDDKYLGTAWKDSEGKLKIYPLWLEELKKLFPTNTTTAVNTFIESGARGLGKSEIAAGVITPYMMHRVMCMKNPLQFYGLKPTEKICFAFMNIKLSLATDIANSKFQKTIQMSPWFMSKGRMTSKDNLPYWVPPEPISLIVGSQASDVIGLPIYCCLDGDTNIVTTDGVQKIKDLVDKGIVVQTINEQGNIELSETCTVKPTMSSSIEYEICLEDDTIIKCTPNHRFMLKDGSYKEAQYLTEDDELFDIKKYGYIYKTTNLINGKIYIGQKHSDKFLAETYLGSGKLLKNAVNKYKKENFKVELLCWCDSKVSLDEMERYYIAKFNSMSIEIGYNIANGGQGGDLGEVCRKRISEKLKGVPKSEEHRHKLSLANKGKKLPEKTKQKIAEANSGKIVSEKTRQKLSEAAKMRDRSQYTSPTKDKISITNGIISKYVDKDSIIPEGWYKGNCNTSGTHDMSKYYNNVEAQIKNSKSKSGSHNSMYHNGYRISGGKNGKAVTDYWYNDIYFDCRKALVDYLKTIDNSITVNIVRKIEHSTYNEKFSNKYKWLITNLRWSAKYEN